MKKGQCAKALLFNDLTLSIRDLNYANAMRKREQER